MTLVNVDTHYYETHTMNVIQSIESAHYVATDMQIEQLTIQVTQGTAASGTYLKALVGTTQAELKAKRRGNPMAAMESVHERFYAAVLRSVAPGDVAMPERIRRATFARSSATTLRRYIEAGLNLRTLPASEVTKGMLRKAIAPPESTDKTERIFKRAQGAILRAFKRAAKKDVANARYQLVSLLEELHTELDSELETHIISTTSLSKAPHRRDDDHHPLL